MNESNIIIQAFHEIQNGTLQLIDFSSQWSENAEFWPGSSCLETMAKQPSHFSAAAIDTSKSKWVGWYLAVQNHESAELLFIFTDHRSRGQGIGKRLLEHLLDQIQMHPEIEALFLEVRPSNQAAIHLYKSFGFEFSSTRPKYYSNGESADVYRLDFKQSIVSKHN